MDINDLEKHFQKYKKMKLEGINDQNFERTMEESIVIPKPKAPIMNVTQEEANKLNALRDEMHEFYDYMLEKILGEDAKRLHPGKTELKVVSEVTVRFPEVLL